MSNNLQSMTTDGDGTIEYFNSAGELHREDGPAVIYLNGSELWYRDGMLHRVDGPAVIQTNGRFKSWWLDNYRLVHLVETCEIEFGFDSSIRPLSNKLVEVVMEYKRFRTKDEFCNWLALEVLGEESVHFLRKNILLRSSLLFDVVESYLCNLSVFDGLPFSWWYPIVESEVGCQ